MFRILATLILSLLTVYITGCPHAGKVSTDEATQENVLVKLLRTDPEHLFQIKPDTTLTLYFDGVPTDFTSSTGEAIVTGKTVEVVLRKGDFIGGSPHVRIGWRENKQTPITWKHLALGDNGHLVWTSKNLPTKHMKWLDAIEIDSVETQEGVPVNFLRADPPNQSSIVGVDTITLYFDNRPTHVKIMKASWCISKAIVKGNTVEVSRNPTRRSPYIGFTVRWRDGNQQLNYKTIE